MRRPESRAPCWRRRALAASAGAFALLGVGPLSGCAAYGGGRGGGGTQPPPPRDVAALFADPGAAILRHGAPIGYRPGLPLQRGDRIQTGGGANALVRFNNGDEVYLNGDSSVEVGSIFVFFGEVFVHLFGTPERDKFRVDTEFVSAGAEGTEYLVRVDRQTNQTTVIVREGVVVCSPRRGAWQPVRMLAREQLVVATPATPSRMVLDDALIQQHIRWSVGAAQRLRRPAADPRPYPQAPPIR